MLGFDVEELGQGSGRQPDGIATAVRNDYAIIYDAKVRGDGYSIATDDRAIREYIETHARQLRDQGVRRIYFAIVSSTFTNPDQGTLRELRETTAVESIVFLSAELLEELMVLRLREPYLNLDDIRAVFGTRDGIFRREEFNNVLPDWRDVTVDEFL
ncbi:restriction endonuclease FokI C-terminal domain-containing protein [Halorubrum distributum]|uniref:restriction endonuclease FokI C-terminal domain-containing protein n=1 Tax=Halorubrum distributum TaxID=29283 RepID=UPI00373AF176